MTRFITLLLACLFLALAIIGAFLPVLPTVPFLLLAAWFSAKGSDRLHRWLYEHPRFGKILINWEKDRAISRSSKTLAIIMLTLSWGFMYFRVDNVWLLASTGLLFILLAVYLITRPEAH